MHCFDFLLHHRVSLYVLKSFKGSRSCLEFFADPVFKAESSLCGMDTALGGFYLLTDSYSHSVAAGGRGVLNLIPILLLLHLSFSGTL